MANHLDYVIELRARLGKKRAEVVIHRNDLKSSNDKEPTKGQLLLYAQGQIDGIDIADKLIIEVSQQIL